MAVSETATSADGASTSDKDTRFDVQKVRADRRWKRQTNIFLFFVLCFVSLHVYKKYLEEMFAPTGLVETFIGLLVLTMLYMFVKKFCNQVTTYLAQCPSCKHRHPLAVPWKCNCNHENNLGSFYRRELFLDSCGGCGNFAGSTTCPNCQADIVTKEGGKKASIGDERLNNVNAILNGKS